MKELWCKERLLKDLLEGNNCWAQEETKWLVLPKHWVLLQAVLHGCALLERTDQPTYPMPASEATQCHWRVPGSWGGPLFPSCLGEAAVQTPCSPYCPLPPLLWGFHLTPSLGDSTQPYSMLFVCQQIVSSSHSAGFSQRLSSGVDKEETGSKTVMLLA